MNWFKIGLCIALLGVSAIAAQTTSAGPVASIEGLWGGDRLQLVIDAKGGRVEMDCASGKIIGPITMAANGNFHAHGTFEKHQPGPQRAEESDAPATTRYSGEVKDGVMKLSILPESTDKAQVFILHKGVHVKLIRCR